MKRALLISSLIAGTLLIAACSGHNAAREGPLAVTESELGPDTGNLIKTLPKGLVGDQKDANYISRPLRGHDDPGGTEKP